MRLTVGFSSLLVSLLCASAIVDARPLDGNAGMVTLPLRSLQSQKEDLQVHPHLYFQQHVNRAHRRLARMTGRAIPSDAQLHDNLHKRVIAIEAAGGETGLAKRYWTNGFVKDKLENLRAASAANSQSSSRSVARRGSSKTKSARRRGLVRRQDDSDDSDDSDDDGDSAFGDDSEDDGDDSDSASADGDDDDGDSASVDGDGDDDGDSGDDDDDGDSASVDGDDEDDDDDSASVDGDDDDDGDASVDGGDNADGDSDDDDAASVGGNDDSDDGEDSSDAGDGNDTDSSDSNSNGSSVTNGSGNSTASTGATNNGGGNSTSNGSASSGSTANTTSSSSAGNSSTDLGGAGFSQIDLNAALNPVLTNANTPTDSDSLGLNIEANDVGYIAVVQLGTPPRNFEILMDSGSADFWVGAENCQTEASSADASGNGDSSSGQGQDLFARARGHGGGNGGGATANTCGNHVFLGKQSSSSFVDTGKNFEVTYGTGDVQGDIITDNVEIAGLKLNKHSFGVATKESDDFSSNSTPFDGLMGLALSSLSEQGVPTPPESLASAGLIKAPITSFKISRLQDQKNDGEITFGGLDSSKFDPNTLVTFANVNTQGFWEGSLAISVDGNDIGLASATTAILDTGTSLIVAPQSDATTFHNAIPGAKADGQGGFTIPCTTTVAVTMTVGGGAFAINPQDLLFLPVDQNDLTGDCISAVSAGQIGGANEWLLGDAFLKNAYFSVDVSTNKISLAKLV